MSERAFILPGIPLLKDLINASEFSADAPFSNSISSSSLFSFLYTETHAGYNRM